MTTYVCTHYLCLHVKPMNRMAFGIKIYNTYERKNGKTGARVRGGV